MLESIRQWERCADALAGMDIGGDAVTQEIKRRAKETAKTTAMSYVDALWYWRRRWLAGERLVTS